MFFWTLDPIEKRVLGDISFGTNLLNPKGATNLGISTDTSPPNSQPGPLLELNQEPSKDIFSNSAPLKAFLSVIENFAEVPIFLMLECVNSVSKPKVYFSIGVKKNLHF